MKPPATAARLTGSAVAIWYCVIAVFSVLALSFLTPPFQVPDEPQHFFRAYQISEFSLRSLVRVPGAGDAEAGAPAGEGGGAGAIVPSSLPELVEHFMGSRAVLAARPVKPAKLRDTLAAGVALDPARRGFVDFSNTAFYVPLPYMPQATAIDVARWLGRGPLGMLYAARLLNGLTAVAVTACALRILPFGQMAAAVMMLLPMVQYEFASAAPDAALIAASVMFTALSLRALERGAWRWPEGVGACVAGAAVCAFKPVYAPLLFIAVPLMFRRAVSRRGMGAAVAVIGVPLACAVLWFGWSAPSIHLPRAGTDAPRQLALVLAHPLGALMILGRSVVVQSPWLLLGAIGRFGWLTIWLPDVLYALPVVALVCALLAGTVDTARPGLRQAAWHGLLLVAAVLLVMLGMYVLWTPPGAPDVQGVQGRYFLPLAPLAAVTLQALAGAAPMQPRAVLACAALIVMAVESVLTACVVARAYSVF